MENMKQLADNVAGARILRHAYVHTGEKVLMDMFIAFKEELSHEAWMLETFLSESLPCRY